MLCRLLPAAAGALGQLLSPVHGEFGSAAVFRRRNKLSAVLCCRNPRMGCSGGSSVALWVGFPRGAFLGDTAQLSSSVGPAVCSACSQHWSSDNIQAGGSGVRCSLFSFFHMRKGHNQGFKKVPNNQSSGFWRTKIFLRDGLSVSTCNLSKSVFSSSVSALSH